MYKTNAEYDLKNITTKNISCKMSIIERQHFITYLSKGSSWGQVKRFGINRGSLDSGAVYRQVVEHGISGVINGQLKQN